jgi:hypothetical protein
MSLDNNNFLLFGKVMVAVFFLLAIFPLKNWLEIKKVKSKELRWINWLNEKPSKVEYCAKYKQNPDKIECDFCGASRQLPSLEMVMTSRPKFGLLNNQFDKYIHFKTYICSGCGTELYRESYEE